jgi:hypothetical protein
VESKTLECDSIYKAGKEGNEVVNWKLATDKRSEELSGEIKLYIADPIGLACKYRSRRRRVPCLARSGQLKPPLSCPSPASLNAKPLRRTSAASQASGRNARTIDRAKM